MAHKIFSPPTYTCNLCNITYGVFKERKSFRETFPVMEFLHIDEFQKKYASKFKPQFTFLIILSVTHKELEVFVTAEKLNKLNSVDELIKLIQTHQIIYKKTFLFPIN